MTGYYYIPKTVRKLEKWVEKTSKRATYLRYRLRYETDLLEYLELHLEALEEASKQCVASVRKEE